MKTFRELQLITEAKQEWGLIFDFTIEYTSREGRDIQKHLAKKFKKHWTGQGSGGSGFDMSFNGPKKELEKIKKYVEKEFGAVIDPKYTVLANVDESVELDEVKRDDPHFLKSGRFHKEVHAELKKVMDKKYYGEFQSSNGGQALDNVINHFGKRRGYRVDKTVQSIIDKYGRNRDEFVTLSFRAAAAARRGFNEEVELDEASQRFGGDTNIPASKEITKYIESGKGIILDVPSTLHPTSRFAIYKNPAKGSGQDKVLMATISDPSRSRIKMFSFHGTHVSHQKAMDFAKKHKLVTRKDAEGNPLYAKESVELDEGKTEFAVVAKASGMLIKAFPKEEHARMYIKNNYSQRKNLRGNLGIIEVPKSRAPGNNMKKYGDIEVVKESVELDEVLSDREMERFTKAHTALHTRYHKQALQIIKFIDSVAKHKEKWTDSFGDYVTAKLPKQLKISNPAGVEYQQGRGRGDWSFLIQHDMVRYNNRNMPWMPKSGELKFDKFMKLLDTWKSETLRESVELDEGYVAHYKPSGDPSGSATDNLVRGRGKKYLEKSEWVTKRRGNNIWKLTFKDEKAYKEFKRIWAGRYTTSESVEQIDEVSYVRVTKGEYKGMTGIVVSSNGYENTTYLVSGSKLLGSGTPKIVSTNNLRPAEGSDRKTLIKIHADGRNDIPGHRQVKRQMKDLMREFIELDEGKAWDAILRIKDQKSAEKVHGMLVDMQTAKLLCDVMYALNKGNQKKFMATIDKNAAGLRKMVDFAWKQVK